MPNHPQVKLLLSMDQSEGALNRAADSLDGDLVFLVLLHLLHSLAASTTGENPVAAKKRLHDFFALVASKPEASALLEAYFRCVQPPPTHPPTTTITPFFLKS
jgi:hypothetical protein